MSGNTSLSQPHACAKQTKHTNCCATTDKTGSSAINNMRPNAALSAAERQGNIEHHPFLLRREQSLSRSRIRHFLSGCALDPIKFPV